MRELDWSRTALGPVSSWPTSLKTTVGVLLGNRFPMSLFWGPSLINFNNDAYRPILGEKHPASLGASGREIWKEIWHILGAPGSKACSPERRRRGTSTCCCR